MIWVATRFSLIVLIKGDEWNVEDGHVDLSWMWKRPCRCYWVTHWGEISFLGMRLWQKDALSKKCMFFGELFFWNLRLLKDFKDKFWFSGYLCGACQLLFQREHRKYSRRVPHFSRCLLLWRRSVSPILKEASKTDSRMQKLLLATFEDEK